MDRQAKAYLYATLAVLAWSTVASAFKLTLRYLEPLQLVTLASVFSTVALLAVLLGQRKIKLLWQYPRKQLLLCLLLGLLNPCAYYFVLFEAYDRLAAQEALAINYTWPVMLAILSVYFLRQPLRLVELFVIGIAYIGVVIIATKGDPFSLDFKDPAGVAFALGSTLLWALFWIFNVKHQQDPTATLCLSFLFSIPILSLATAIFAPIREINLAVIAGSAYVGLFEMGITFVLWLTALKLSDSTAKIGTLVFVSPFLSLLFINVFVGESIHEATLLGLILIVFAIALQTALSRRPAP